MGKILRKDMRLCTPSLTSIRGFSTDSGVSAKTHSALFELKKQMWTKYFKETTAATATAFEKPGIQATCEEAYDTSNHPFITDPVLGMFHRVAESSKNDPFLKLYEEYLECRDPKREKELLAKIDSVLPVEFNESKEEVLEKLRVPYLFLSEFSGDKH